MAEQKKLRIGVLGAYRGTSMISYCDASDNAEVVAICDKWPEALNRQKENYKDRDIATFKNADLYIKDVKILEYLHTLCPRLTLRVVL